LVDIIIDSREPKAREFQTAFIDAGLSATIEALDAGDFLIYGHNRRSSMLIERKAASDFLHSITATKKNGTYKPGRIWDQIKRMKETELDTYILIEGNPHNQRQRSYYLNGMTLERIWGAMSGIENWGMKIHRVNNITETKKWVIFRANKMKKPKASFALRTSPPNTMTLEEMKIYLIEGFPGIGPKKAEKIVKDGSLMKFFKNISKTKLVTDKQRKVIKQILTK
jgi:ERCC4-type nuclease